MPDEAQRVSDKIEMQAWYELQTWHRTHLAPPRWGVLVSFPLRPGEDYSVLLSSEIGVSEGIGETFAQAARRAIYWANKTIIRAQWALEDAQ